MKTKDRTFAIKLRQLRRERGYTQKQLATLLQTAESTVGMYEQGRRRPCPEIMRKIEQLFALPPGYLQQTDQEAGGLDLLSSEIRRRLR